LHRGTYVKPLRAKSHYTVHPNDVKKTACRVVNKAMLK
jgi:hypothetical protein